MTAVKDPERQWMDLIHEKGVLLFGAKYNKKDSEERIYKWLNTNKDMTIRGIYSTIRWWYDICGHSTDDARGGFGIVPYVYEDAKKYFIDNRDMHRAYYTKEAMNECVSPDTVQVRIKPPEYKAKTFLDGFQLS